MRKVPSRPARGLARRVDAVLTTPAHQFPTGAVLAPHRREALLAWASRTGALVLEDDYDGEFRFDRRAVGSLQGLAPDTVVYLGSTSKALAPTLRLGWIVSPLALMERLVSCKFLTDHGSATLDQLALGELITCGAYDRHVRQSRIRYKSHREALQDAVSRHDVPRFCPGSRRECRPARPCPTSTIPTSSSRRRPWRGSPSTPSPATG
ncbi:aminotransferase class I/II-fold pyridoxal phosphate-dependent enzyme [Spirillospora sp. CA-294931]|uniref:aminotransferase class I/II-fold pyridoxal phosphate-dependent enzyme n=1 Tax=Spirillospora sp. CA-294931 TaxID=3240042 RepID=UPI003D900502